KVSPAMASPAVMLVMAIGVTIFLLTWVMPKFTPIFHSRGLNLPKPPQFLLTASNLLITSWYFWLGGAVSLIAGFIFGKRTEPGRQAWDWLKISLPILGSALRKVIISRTIRTLGVM